MKKNCLLTLLVFVSFIFVSETVSAKGIPVFYSTGPHFETTKKLPADMIIDGAHYNFGVAYEQFSIFWIPIWNYGTTGYALVKDDGKFAYTDLDAETLQSLKDEYGIDSTAAPSISFWNKIGGKLILGAVILLIIWGAVGKKKEEPEQTEPEEEEVESEKA